MECLALNLYGQVKQGMVIMANDRGIYNHFCVTLISFAMRNENIFKMVSSISIRKFDTPLVHSTK